MSSSTTREQGKRQHQWAFPSTIGVKGGEKEVEHDDRGRKRMMTGGARVLPSMTNGEIVE